MPSAKEAAESGMTLTDLLNRLLTLECQKDDQTLVLVRWIDVQGQAITFTIRSVSADQGVVILESEVSLS